MNIFNLDTAGFCGAESDLCTLHRVANGDEQIGRELQEIRAAFIARFPRLLAREDYEFPDWHHYQRLFWVYLYHDDFYTPELIPFVQQILQAAPRSWFAEFECYSPALVSEDSNPAGYVGDFLIYKETVIFDDSEGWSLVKARLQITVK